MQHIRRAALQLLFPIHPTQNVAIFLFLILAFTLSNIDELRDIFAQELSRAATSGPTDVIALTVMTFLLIAVFAVFATMVVLVLLGKLNANAVPGTKDKIGVSLTGDNRGSTGIAILMYFLGIISTALTYPGPTAFVLFLVFIAMCVLADPFNEKLREESGENIHELSDQLSLLGVVISGGLFLYYWLFKDQYEFQAVISAYFSFLFFMMLYRVGAEVIKKLR